MMMVFITGACNNNSNKPSTPSTDSTAHAQHGGHSDTTKGSPHRAVMADIGNAHVHIEYSAPAVRNRVIWGGLVPYDAVWVTGAHRATSINISEDMIIADHALPAGKYAFFTIPGKEKWTVIINKNWQQHLADDYDQKEDVFRFMVTPQYDQPLAERLTYAVQPGNNGEGTISVAWEKWKISFPVKTK